MSIRKIFKPKPNKFISLLIKQTSLTVKGLDLLIRYMEKRDAEIARQISKVEKEADEVRRILIEELMKTFITPFDREDIFSLSREIDDVIDYANTTVDEMEILQVDATPFMHTMAKHLYEAAVEIELAVERLQDGHGSVSSNHVNKAKSLENQVESVYREALAELFKGRDVSNKRILKLLKAREIYRHLSNAADREDSAANVIADIVMKST